MQIFKIHKKLNFLKTTKGLDYFLNGFKKSQIEIEKTSLKDVKNQKIMTDI